MKIYIDVLDTESSSQQVKAVSEYLSKYGLEPTKPNSAVKISTGLLKRFHVLCRKTRSKNLSFKVWGAS